MNCEIFKTFSPRGWIWLPHFNRIERFISPSFPPFYANLFSLNFLLNESVFTFITKFNDVVLESLSLFSFFEIKLNIFDSNFYVFKLCHGKNLVDNSNQFKTCFFPALSIYYARLIPQTYPLHRSLSKNIRLCAVHRTTSHLFILSIL